MCLECKGRRRLRGLVLVLVVEVVAPSCVGAQSNANYRMATNPSVSDQPFLGQAVVLFADLLGFSARSIADWGDGIQFSQLVMKLKRDVASFEYPAIGTGGREYAVRPMVSTMSDSFVVTLPIGEGMPLSIALLAAKVALSLMSEFAAAEGFAVRAGIELGDIYRTETDVFGPALSHAYSIESKVADRARCVLGPRLLAAVGNDRSDYFDPCMWATYISTDGLICLRYPSQPELRDRIEQIRRSAPPHLRYKFDEILSDSLMTTNCDALRQRPYWAEKARDWAAQSNKGWAILASPNRR